MSAQIIQFPRKTPLEEHELPAHWSEALKSRYVHWTYDGFKSHEEAFEYCETMSQVEPRRQDESERDYLLRRATAAFRTLKPLER